MKDASGCEGEGKDCERTTRATDQSRVTGAVEALKAMEDVWSPPVFAVALIAMAPFRRHRLRTHRLSSGSTRQGQDAR